MVAIEQLLDYRQGRVVAPVSFLELSNWLMKWFEERLRQSALYATSQDHRVRLTKAVRHHHGIRVEGVLFRCHGDDCRAITAIESAILVNLKPIDSQTTQLWVANSQWPQQLFPFVDELVMAARVRWSSPSAVRSVQSVEQLDEDLALSKETVHSAIYEVQPLIYGDVRKEVVSSFDPRPMVVAPLSQLERLQTKYRELCLEKAHGDGHTRLTLREFVQAEGFTIAGFKRTLKSLDADWMRDFVEPMLHELRAANATEVA
jgi:hypothetical protein